MGVCQRKLPDHSLSLSLSFALLFNSCKSKSAVPKAHKAVPSVASASSPLYLPMSIQSTTPIHYGLSSSGCAVTAAAVSYRADNSLSGLSATTPIDSSSVRSESQDSQPSPCEHVRIRSRTEVEMGGDMMIRAGRRRCPIFLFCSCGS